MKKTALILFVCIACFVNSFVVQADYIDDLIESWYVPGFSSGVVVFNEMGEVVSSPSALGISVNFGESGSVKNYSEFYTKSKQAFINSDDEIKNLILSDVGENERFCVMNFADEDEDIYPDFEKMYVQMGVPTVYGGRTPLWGEDYRLYLLENGILTEMPITESSDEEISFEIDDLGMYILYFNINAYEVEFYEELPMWQNGSYVPEAFYVVDGLGKSDIVDFPEVPAKDRYVFTGWKQEDWVEMYTTYFYVEPTNITAFDLWRVYASWCPEDEYTPLEVSIESEEITKGKEDGKEITLTLSEGKFDEVIDSDIETQWKVVGNDELSVAAVEKIDDKAVKLTLSGNSSDKYADGEIQIEFDSNLYISWEPDEHGGFLYETSDIQLDENGMKKAMFISDNSIKLNKQKKSSSSGVTYYTVLLDANGGDDVAGLRVKRGNTAQEPEVPVKEGYIFAGWYKDEGLTEKYDFKEAVTEDITLYAAWEEDNSKKIILVVGEKEAVVFGETITNDVAPVITNDRVMIPLRFVAESLGAEVIWNAEKPNEVKIVKDDTEIVIYIGESEAYVNGEKTALDSPAFLENDRTYIPIRFVAENLGCGVEWEDGTKEVVIKK